MGLAILTSGLVLAHYLSLITFELFSDTLSSILRGLLISCTSGTNSSIWDNLVSITFVWIAYFVTNLSSCIWHTFSASSIFIQNFSLSTAWFNLFRFIRDTIFQCLILYKSWFTWFTFSIYTNDKFAENAFISFTFEFSIFGSCMRWALSTPSSIIWVNFSFCTSQIWNYTIFFICIGNKTKLTIITLPIYIDELILW